MTIFKRAAAVVLLCAVQGAGARRVETAGASPILGILQSELQRNMQVLKQQAVPAYFGAYTVYDEHTTQIVASFGAVDRSDETHQRFATVEMRVGDYTLDNTHPMRGDARAMGPRLAQVSLPLTDDDKPIRLAMWRATDRTYKTATEALTRVQTNVAAKVKDDDPAPDFSREDPQTYSGPAVNYALDQKAWEAKLRRVSALFSGDPLIFSGDVSLSVEADNRFYTNSEGSQIAQGDVACRVFIQAVTKAPDGMDLPLYSSYFATSPDGLPEEKQLMADARSMMELLGKLRKAPLVDPFSGPAILSGRAAGVFFHEIFGHRVEGNRQRSADDAQTFSGKIGQPVLPPFLSVVFDPTLKKVGNIELMGHYVYDDQGVKGQRTTVVDKGVLKTFLLDRAPLKAGASAARSNGHGRAEPGYAPVSRQSNLVVESSKSVSDDELMKMLREEAKRQGKEFGLFFDNIEGGFTNTQRGSANAFNVLPNVVYRIYTDGRAPELVRGVDLIGTPLSAFAKIAATGDKTDVFNGVCGAESGGVPVSASSPALLVSEVEVQKKAQSQETAPILPAPAPAKKIMRTRILAVVILITITLPGPGVRAQQSPLILAMQDEMKRSMSELRMKDAPAPYYIAYEVQDRTVTDVSGRLGALIENLPRRMRILRVEVRVGDYTFDSSRFVSQGFGGGGGLNGETALVSLDDDYDAIRRDIWITTDEAYKRAVNTFARKRAAFQNRSTADPLPDFSRELPVETQLPATPASAGRDLIVRVQEPSVAIGANPAIDASEVSISEIHGTRYFLNSEGFRTVAPIQLASLNMYAEAQAPDGMPVRETYSTVESTVQDLPSAAELVTRARELSGRIAAARTAPIGEEFTGPVLLEGAGSAQFIAETLLPLVAARRSPDSDNPRMAQGLAPPTPFLSRTGLRVMADSFSASDTPSLKQFNGKPVAGAYVVDDEGVRAKDVTLVDKGRLVTLLTSRTPQKNFPQSNGHGRANGAWAGVFQLESAQAIPASELKTKYLALLKAQEKTFGYIVRDVRPSGGAAGAGPGIDQVVKVTLDGNEEPVRGLRFATVPSTAFRDVSEASQERALYNYRGALTSAVSVIAPSLIFEELEIQRTRDILQKPPVCQIR